MIPKEHTDPTGLFSHGDALQLQDFLSFRCTAQVFGLWSFRTMHSDLNLGTNVTRTHFRFFFLFVFVGFVLVLVIDFGN